MWRKLSCSKKELQLIGTLNGGQCFRWRKHVSKEEPLEQWIGIFENCIWWLAQDDENIFYKVYDPNNHNKEDEPVPTKKSKLDHKNKTIKKNTKTKPLLHNIENINNVPEEDKKYENLLRKYFQLHVNIKDYYQQWSKADPYFEKAAEQFYGIRILAQDPVENLFSFICSQNNHISRISGMVEKLCTMYGPKIYETDTVEYYSFPSVEDLSGPDVESQLRTAGFGYRARYISRSANAILEMGGSKWFDKLKNMDYKDAKSELIKLYGIGAKVADCICLMSLGHLEAIPVDTHIFQIARTCYLPHLAKSKTVTDKIYNEIGDYFRHLYGPLAGWAHTVLFCADLKMFQNKEATKNVG